MDAMLDGMDENCAGFHRIVEYGGEMIVEEKFFGARSILPAALFGFIAEAKQVGWLAAEIADLAVDAAELKLAAVSPAIQIVERDIGNSSAKFFDQPIAIQIIFVAHPPQDVAHFQTRL